MIELVIAPRRRSIGESEVERLLPFAKRRMVGPFIFLDRFGPHTLAAGSSNDVEAHPHIGLSTLTYLLEGRMIHRDSTGAVQVIDPGEVNWMTAGSGVCHTERGHPDDLELDRNLHGLQLWVALPDGSEDLEPSFVHAGRDELPTVRFESSTVRVLVGEAYGLRSPVAGFSPLGFVHVDVDAHSPVPVDDTHSERAILPLDGSFELVSDALDIDPLPLQLGHLHVLEPGTGCRLVGYGNAVVVSGEPVGKRNIRWNFVHSDLSVIERAERDWSEGRFPKVPNDHRNPVPLPYPIA